MTVLEFSEFFTEERVVNDVYMFGRVSHSGRSMEWDSGDRLLYDEVYTFRRPRKIISDTFTKHVVREMGDCMEGDSCPLPAFYTLKKNINSNGGFTLGSIIVSGDDQIASDAVDALIHRRHRRKRHTQSNQPRLASIMAMGGRWK